METTPLKITTYTAILNQSGSDAPVATILHNTLVPPSLVMWQRTTDGNYTGTPNIPFSDQNTVVFITNTNTSRVLTAKVDADLIRIEQTQSGSPTDGLNDVTIEIKQYTTV